MSLIGCFLGFEFSRARKNQSEMRIFVELRHQYGISQVRSQVRSQVSGLRSDVSRAAQICSARTEKLFFVELYLLHKISIKSSHT